MAVRMGWLGAVLAAGMMTVSASGQELATGGDFTEDIVVDGVPYRVHVFTNTTTTHTFEVLVDNLEVEYLIVGGGGGGGSDDAGGGGGGGVLSSERPGSTPFLCAQQTYPVDVGAGGRGSGTGNADLQENGESSSIFGFTALGGGFGANGQNGARLAGSAGTGGGGDGERPTDGASGTSGQGFKGGNGYWTVSFSGHGGGGGGAGSEGLDGTSSKPGDGGDGFVSDIHGSSRHYGAGGGGGDGDGGSGGGTRSGGGGGSFAGPGIGAGSAVQTGGNGEPSSGGGAGASATTGSSGGTGGSGIVIVRYATTTDLPGIHNVGVADRTDTTADIAGMLITNGVSEATVTLYWATTDYTNNAAGWEANGDSMEVGPYADGESFTNTVSELSAHTWYYWNHSAVNASGTVWAASSGSPSFRTLGPPSVDNADGATAISATLAMLHGTLLDGAPADVYVDLWVDGADVTNRFDLGSRELGAFSVQATGLTPDTLYGYRCFVSNDFGTAWAEAPTNFTTLATAYTDGDVTWSGDGAVPYWELAANWVGNEAPMHETSGILTFPTSDTSRLDDDYQVKQVIVSGAHHTIDLGGHTLTLTHDTAMAGTAPRMIFTGPEGHPGTLRVGLPGAPADIRTTRTSARLLIGDGVTLGGNIRDIRPSREARIDLRGAVMEDGILAVDGIYSAREPVFYLDDTTVIDTLLIRHEFANRGSFGMDIGNPAHADRRLPSNLVVIVGSDLEPAIFDMGVRNTGHHGHMPMGPINFNASSGGSFTGRLSRLRVAHNIAASGSARCQASMKLAGMDSCDIVTESISIGTIADESHTTPVRGTLSLPAGDVKTGTLVMGRDQLRDSNNWADLLLDGTRVEVTNAVVLNRTSEVIINLHGESAGLDLDANASFTLHRTLDDGASLHVEFVEPPVPGEDIYWGLRIAGDEADELTALQGLGWLTYAFDTNNAAFDGKHVGILYTNDFTYFAMADENYFDFSPVAITRDRTLEVESGGTVMLAPLDIDEGSFDPLERDFSLTMNYGDQTGLTELELTALGPHTVTLVITIDGEPSETGQADATVTLVEVVAGTEQDLVWTAGASTELMDRPEWFWGANWDLEQPPLNPSAVNLNFPLGGTSIAAPESGTTLEVGEIMFDDAVHTIDLDGNTLITGDLRLRRVFATAQGIFTGPDGEPGILRVGKPGSPANIVVSTGRVNIGDGVTLGGTIGTISTSGQNSILDLRGAVMEDGLLEMHAFNGGRDAYCYIDDTTGIDRLRVLTQVLLRGVGGQNMGDPASPDRAFPADLEIEIGSDATPAILDVGVRVSSHNYMSVAGNFNASTGGSFTGRLSRLQVGHNTSVATGSAAGFMKLAGMNGCEIVTQIFNIGTTTPAMATEPGAVRGLVSLPSGAVQTGTLVLGRDWVRDSNNYADLILNGTRFAVTNTATIHESGIITIAVGEAAAGLELAADATLTIDGAVHINFTGDPAGKSEPHYGISWEGDHAASLQALWDAEAIVVTGEELLSRPVEVYQHRGVTYLGLAPLPPGSLFMLR